MPPTSAVSNSDTDEFAVYDFSEFTEEDFAHIDAEVTKKHYPRISIAYEAPGNELSSSRLKSEGKPRKIERSPLHRYRPRGTISVTDLTSPSWCEVQFEYGLQGRRSRPLHERPKSFKSTSGKEIKADKQVAVKNDVILTKGKSIHKSLEREVKPEEVIVNITSLEERWGLRLVNMLSCLEGMRLTGFTREIPVFGIRDGNVVVGIIDELVYRSTSAESDGVSRAADPTLTQVNGKQETVDSTLVSSGFGSSHKLQIIDTKTRKRPSLPYPSDTIPARLQLMLYHRLLSDLVSLEHPFDFMFFWSMAGVDPTRQFSARFLAQAGLIAGYDQFQVQDLADLSALWHDLVHQLGIVGVDDELKLIYRSQASGRRRNKLATPEEAAFSSATEGSLLDARQPSDHIITSGESVIPPLDQGPVESENVIPPTAKDEQGNETHTIIGTKVFRYDPDFLSSHLADILEWWRGEREPRGVPVELSYRCHTCEYFDDCEWREKRAEEFSAQAGLKEAPVT